MIREYSFILNALKSPELHPKILKKPVDGLTMFYFGDIIMTGEE